MPPALPLLSAMGVETVILPTAVLSTHTMFSGYTFCDLTDEFEKIADHWAEQNITFDAIYTGYLGSFRQLELVSRFIDRFRTKDTLVVIDPVMGDHGKLYANLSEDYVQAYLRLCPYADVMLPNLTEACLLTSTVYQETDRDDSINILCEALHRKGAKAVVLTSLPAMNQTKGIALSQDNTFESFVFDGEALEFHGTGDVFDAVFCGAYLRGEDMKTCIYKAHHFVKECMKESSKFSYPEREGLMLESNLSLLV